MQRIVAIVLAVLLGFAAPAFAQTGNTQASGQPAPQSSSDGLTAMAQEGDGTPSPLLVGGVALGVGALVVVLASHRSHSP